MSSNERNHESAQWVDEPNPPWYVGILNRRRSELLALLDGAYFGLQGEDIVNIETDGSLVSYEPHGHYIIGSNPGVQKLSRHYSRLFLGVLFFVL